MGYARIVVGGVGSDTGKTTVAVGLMGALARRGLRVQGFKVGPDYIDPTYHRLVTGRPSRNLDAWLMGEEGVVSDFTQAMRDADIGVIEGVMGYFDGINPADNTNSTCDIAGLLGAPPILVVDAWGMARSAAAVVLGFTKMARGCPIRGVILNRVGGDAHAKMCREAIERVVGVPVLGALKRDPQVELPSRHLGLYLADRSLEEKVDRIVELVEGSVDLDRVLEMARQAPPLPPVEQGGFAGGDGGGVVRVGVALDGAFAFYYESNFELLRRLGAKLVFFSPTSDAEPPEVDALYIGGGYPQLEASSLELNQSMRHRIKELVEDELPVYAECGGLMYLGKAIETVDGKKHRMVGVFELETALTRRLTLGYTELEAVSDTPFTSRGETFRGHEFHYSEARDVSPDCRFTYRLRRGKGIVGGMDGCTAHRALASYSHLHFMGNPKIAARLVDAAKTRRRR